ncbi:peptidase inhibitor family I36 protein [Kitasatospora sp. NPDC057542]|uniref:peptidase inhibitor family I36 protein n=1 Tax=Streptomycetaceae TaxID=2062 RepID=UPI001CCFC8EC|nr:peptidase inhibitor family I36 protein [Streptomyces sp. LS1784]
MKLSQKMTRLGLCAAAAVGLVVTVAGSASANTILGLGQGAGACPANYVCLWSDYGYVAGGPDHKFGSIASDQNIGDMGKLERNGALWDGMQDVASSVVNNTGSSICFYENNWYTGLEFKIGPRERWSSVPSWINDKISSFKYC